MNEPIDGETYDDLDDVVQDPPDEPAVADAGDADDETVGEGPDEAMDDATSETDREATYRSDSKMARIEVTASGDLSVTGSEGDEISVAADPESTEMTELDGVVRIVLADDGAIRVPRRVDVTIVSASGDVAMRALDGAVTIGDVGGDLALSRLGPTTIANVGGDVAVRGVAGDLYMGQIGGDAAVARVQGNLTATAVGADLALRSVDGDVTATAGADIDAALQPAAGRLYRLTAGADIDCRLPDGVGVQIVIRSGAGEPRVRLADAPPVDLTEGTARLTLGDGSATAELIAGGRVTLRGPRGEDDEAQMGYAFGEEFGRMAEEIARQVDAQTTRLTIQLGEHLSKLTATLPGVLSAAGLDEADADRIAERTQRSVERAAEQARRRAEAAMQRMEARLARTEDRVERDVRRAERRRTRVVSHGPVWAPSPPSPPAPPPPPSREPVTDAERLAILRMVQEKRITIAEAERLLAALEA